MKKQLLPAMFLTCYFALTPSLGAAAATESVENFLKGKAGSLTGIDGGTVGRDNRQAPGSDPGYKVPVLPAGNARAAGTPPQSDNVDNFLKGKSDVLRGVDSSVRFSNDVRVVDDGPVVHDYRQAPSNDPGFKIPAGPSGTVNDTSGKSKAHRSDVTSACKCLDQTKYERKAEINNFLNGRSSQLCGYDLLGPSPVKPVTKGYERDLSLPEIPLEAP